MLHVQIEESLQQLYRPTVVSRTKLPKSSDNSPSTAYSSAVNSNPQQSSTCQAENVDTLKALLSPRKRTKTRKHNRSSTVPMMLVKTSNGSNLASSMMSTPNKIKVKQRKIQEMKKSPPITNPNSPYNSKDNCLLEKDFKKLNEFERVKRIKVMAEKVSRVS